MTTCSLTLEPISTDALIDGVWVRVATEPATWDLVVPVDGGDVTIVAATVIAHADRVLALVFDDSDEPLALGVAASMTEAQILCADWLAAR